MDYETGTSTDPADLLSKLATFATANGWTVATPTSGSVFSKGDIFVGMIASTNDMSFRGALSYDSGVSWDNQPNNAGVSTICDLGAGPYTAYHFFAGSEEDQEYLHAAVEIAAGHFRHFAMGQLIKVGVYTGGTYVSAVRWDNSTSNQNNPEASAHTFICDAQSSSGTEHVWIDYDGKTDNWQRAVQASDFTTTRCTGSVRGNGMDNMFENRGYLRWNLRSVPAPLNYFANRASSLRSFIGRIPHMRVFGMQNLSPGQVVTIGGDSWKVFPVCQRTESFGSGNSSIESSGYYGYGYRIES